jgi:hypothetical protein
VTIFDRIATVLLASAFLLLAHDDDAMVLARMYRQTMNAISAFVS